jgi:PAS domain S-box-containing protein
MTSERTGYTNLEEALRFSEERYRALFQENPTMIVTVDADGIMLSVNPFCAKRLGYTIDELEGQSVLKLFHEEDRAALTEQLKWCLNKPDQVHHWQFRNIRKDREVLSVDEMARAVYDLNGKLDILILCQDVTGLKLAEEAVRNSEIRFRRLFETTKEGILILDGDTGQIIEVNPFLVELLGYSREEFVSKKLWEIGILTDFPASKANFSTLQQNDFIRYENLPLMTKDGRQIDVEFISNVYSINGTKMIQCNIRDITDRRRAEEEIARLNVDLALRASELEAANLELEAFNYMVAHDLRQPLHVISTYCQAIQMKCGDEIKGECAGYIQQAHQSALRMNGTIEALLNFSRTAQTEPRKERVDLSAMAREVIDMLRLAEPERQVAVRIPDGVTANADKNMLRIVLDNLLGNAWKHSGIKEEAVIEFGVTEIDEVSTYFVRDNGTGFDQKNADQLFIPFRRLPGAEAYRGFGVGLATVERIIRRHGGKIWAEGAPGRGATFYFTLFQQKEN